ncbi:putative Sugar phosphate exchanger 2 [Senna tora]|uniref:Putative Sugar phosphate exchanger 2 n=1 Tax=Senna tora TaxID=362788 RepID=A0A834WN58_9FABA|nr:putative Sugar phosphate exchanger 2 [Senna tora]
MDRGLPWLPVTSGGGRSSDEPHKYDDVAVSFSDTVFGFWEDVQASSSENSSDSGESRDDENIEEDENFCTEESNKHFWEQQYHLLQASLCKSSSFETKIRQATKEVLRELNRSDMQYCICQRVVAAAAAKGCRSCLQREIWEHTYLEAMDKSNSKRGEIKVIIELNFQGEFEMARANEEYNQLIRRLPQVYVGKLERLQVLIKILCSAAKQCMKENKMHLGPWRKLKYVQAKWLGTSDRSTWPLPTTTGSYSVRPPRFKASMLTFDLLDNINIPASHRTAVKVV